MEIKKLSFKEVDFNKYTKTIRHSAQFIFQVEKEYMTAINGENWDFLIYEDYKAVLPVPFVKKWGLKIVIPPMAIQQLGVFSESDNCALNNAFYDYLLKHYRVYYYPFNATNQLAREVVFRNNYIIEKQDYELVKSQYSKNRRRNIRLNDKNNKDLLFSESNQLEPIKSFFIKNIRGYHSLRLKEKVFQSLTNLYHQKLINIYQITKNDHLISLATIVNSDKEAYFLYFVNDKSVSSNAASLMVDQILQRTIEHKNFSFWGSNIPSIAMFYERFGAKLTKYPTIPLSKKRLFKI